jgi:hypothetical protein
MINPALNAALIAAANKQPASSAAILARLRKAGATSRASAAAPDLSGKGAEAVLRKLVEKGHLRAAGGGLYWIEVERVASSQATARQFGLVLLVFLVSAGASAVALLAHAG